MMGRRVGHAQLALAGLGACAAAASPVSAQSDAEGSVQIAWDAPPGCPDREVLVRRLADALADAPPGLGAGWHVRGRVRADRERAWVLVLELRAPGAAADAPPAERVLSARDCDDLGEAAAVAIAIALDDAQKAGVGAPASGPALPSAAISTELAAPAPGAGDSAPDRATGASTLSRQTQEPLRLALAADGVLDSASLGGLAWGVSLELQGWWRRFGVGAYGVWLPPRATQLGTGQSAEFSLLGGGLHACYRAPADWLWVSPCVGMEVARFEADSAGLRSGRDVRDVWLAGTAGVAFGSRVLGQLGLHSRVEIVLPMRRQEYLVDEDQPIHRVPAATLRWLVGIDAGGG
ncbi:MAG TPA: hypothetical protein VNN80_15010 [Polyangiaceae bacterium]|nr:hypothetical protein [Polyangiaceae bacterium]